MEITIPLFSVLAKKIKKFICSKAVTLFAIVLLSLTHTNSDAQVTNLTSDVNPSCVGATVTFTATVTGTGNVSFYDGTATGTLIGTSPVNTGSAVLSYAGLTQGTHTITAVFDGDGSSVILTGGQVVGGPP